MGANFGLRLTGLVIGSDVFETSFASSNSQSEVIDAETFRLFRVGHQG